MVVMAVVISVLVVAMGVAVFLMLVVGLVAERLHCVLTYAIVNILLLFAKAQPSPVLMIPCPHLETTATTTNTGIPTVTTTTTATRLDTAATIAATTTTTHKSHCSHNHEHNPDNTTTAPRTTTAINNCVRDGMTMTEANYRTPLSQEVGMQPSGFAGRGVGVVAGVVVAIVAAGAVEDSSDFLQIADPR